MKAVMKNKFLYIFGLLTLAIACFFVGFSLSGKAVKADTAGSGITFELGASVRLEQDATASGIRFTANVDEDTYAKVFTSDGQNRENAELGMIIVPESYVAYALEKNRTDYFPLFKEVMNKDKADISVRFNASKVIKKGAGYEINGALVDIKEQNFGRTFRAIAYYTVDGGESYTYFVNQEPRSITQVSIMAIQREDERETEYTDIELNTLYTYADGQIPRVIYDAGKESHLSKMQPEENANLSLTQGDGGEEWFEYEALQDGMIIADNVVDNLNLDKYECVYFKVKTDRKEEGAYCGFCPRNSIDDNGYFAPLTKDEVFSTTISVSDFIEGDKAGYVLVTKGLQAGDKVWLSSFTAINEDSVQAMIDGLPEEGILNVEEKKEVTKAREYCNAIDDSNLDTAKLEKAERLAMKALDVATDEGKARFVYPDEWVDKDEKVYQNGAGDIQTITDLSGAKWYQFKAKDNSGKIYFHFNLKDVDFTGYEYASFILATDADEDDRVKFHSWWNWEAGGGGSADELPSKRTYKCTISIEHLLYMASEAAVVSGLKEGESFYMTDIVVHNRASVEDRLSTLKTEGYLTALEKRELSMLEDVREKTKVDRYSGLDWSRLETARSLAMLAVDTKQETAVKRIENADDFKVSMEKAADGSGWYKFVATEETEKAGQGSFNWNMSAVDFSKYEYVYYNLKTDAKNPTEVGVASSSAPTEFAMLEQDGTLEVMIDRADFMGMVNETPAIISGLKAGEAFYISEVQALNVSDVQSRIDALPSGGVLTAEEKKEQAVLSEICEWLPSGLVDTTSLTIVDGLPVAAWNAGEAEDLNRVLAGSGLRITQVTENGVDWFCFEALDDSDPKEFSLIVPDVDISGYEYITYDFATSAENPVLIGSSLAESEEQWLPVDSQKTVTCTAPIKDFLAQMTAPVQLKGLKTGEKFYMSSMIAFDSESVQAMYTAMPTEGIMSTSQKRDIQTAAKLWGELDSADQDSIDRSNAEKAALLPMRAFDPSEENSVEMWANQEVLGFEGEVSRVQINGKWYFKFTLTKKATEGSKYANWAAFSLDIGNMDYSGYDYMLYDVFTDSKHEIRFTQGTVGETEEKFQPLGGIDGASIIKVGENRLDYAPSEAIDYLKYGGHSLMIYGLDEGESFYISEFIAFNRQVLQNMIDLLPDPETVTEADRAQIELARQYYDHSEYKNQASCTDPERSDYVDLTKLIACEERLKG